MKPAGCFATLESHSLGLIVAAPRQRKMKQIQVDTNISIQGQQLKLITFVFSARMN